MKEVRGEKFIVRFYGEPNIERIKKATEDYCRKWIFKQEKSVNSKPTK